MKFVTYTGDHGVREEAELPTLGAVAGRGFDELVLTGADLQRLRELPPDMLHKWVNHMFCKVYRPPVTT